MADAFENARVAFTGKLSSMTRREACQAVRLHGGEISSYVSHQTTMLVVGMQGWPLLPNGQISRKLRRAEDLRQAGCPIRILAEPAFLELVGRLAPAPETGKSFAASEVCRILGIDEEILRRWEQFGLVRSREGLYDFQDLVSIQTIHGLANNGVRPEKIAASLRNLAALLPDMERPLAQLHIFAEKADLLLMELEGVRFSDTGQMLLNFDGNKTSRGMVLPLDPMNRDLEDWYELGIECEEEGLYAEAGESFRAVLALNPLFAQAHLHLGNVMREMGITWAAEEFYLTATKVDPAMESAWVNLGGVQEDQGRMEDAVRSYEAALSAAPDCADGHFSLALCLEKMGHRCEARSHWFSFLKLDPTSPSAPVARRCLSVRTQS